MPNPAGRGLLRTGGLLLAALLTLAASACSKSEYRSGLGELMNFNQIRHAKLWFAGRAGNWPLAAYEVDELQEGFDDVVKYYPLHEGSSLPLSGLIPKMTQQPMADLRKAIAAHDADAFTKAYDSLTVACNSCHEAANFGINVVKRPSDGASDGAWFSNQEFAPKADQ